MGAVVCDVPKGLATTYFGPEEWIGHQKDPNTRRLEDVVASPQGAPQTTAPGHEGLANYQPLLAGRYVHAGSAAR